MERKLSTNSKTVSTQSKIFAIYGYFVTLIGAGYFILFGVILSLVALLIRPLVGKRLALMFGRYAMHYLLRIFLKGLSLSKVFCFDLSALDQLKKEKGVIIAPNHPCLMDALFFISRLPNVVCVMKASLQKNPILFGGAWLAGFIRSDSPLSFITQCWQSLDNGSQLLLFPEGTRSFDSQLNPFKLGLGLIAKQAARPVQTVFIKANSNFLGKHWPLLKMPQFPLVYRVSLGKRFNLSASQDHRVFMAELENYFKQQL